MKKSFQIEQLRVHVYATKEQMSQKAAEFVTKKLNEAIEHKGCATLILATGASQFEFLDFLKRTQIDWSKITVFHLDEYKDMTIEHPASFRKYLQERILDDVKPANVHFLQGDADNSEKEVQRYEALLKQHEIDIACIGIGENGHLAFNDPPVADFNDPRLVKVVELDETCRRQQLGEGWFPRLADVPTHALSLTIPAIMRCKAISCVVPDERKAPAVRAALLGDISTKCPASVLRRHADAVMWLDEKAASQLNVEK
ncbi:glucosamine-6-phosphate deaminase [candidate division KSB1 bacterium]|nr:glucosamine-6-phosphate deaminase [candidate division KSB1 bacterium]RQW01317.1 MAG: glucosamine-6-phosphate deaminase [candidate division KSB1 bacterium]